MIINIERGLGNTPESEAEKESPGHEAERIVLDFLEKSDIGFEKVERTEILDENDRNGVDAVGKIGGEEVAIDITFNNDREVLKGKMERNLRNPLYYFHDEQGKPIGEPIPRILIREISMANWIKYSEEAETRGGDLMGAIDIPFKRRKQKQFLEEILNQIDGLSRHNSDYAKRIKPVKKIFEERLEKITD